MTFPVIVHPAAGQFEAALVGAPEVCATAATREEALLKLESAISKRLDKGELVALEVRRRGLAGRTEAVRLPDAPWLDDDSSAPFDLPRYGTAERVQPRLAVERLPELPT